MEENYDPMIYTLVDEDGVEHSFELLDTLEENGVTYYAMTPYYENPEDLAQDDGELVVLKGEMDGEEEIMATIDDDDEYNRIGGIFLERIEEMFYDADDSPEE